METSTKCTEKVSKTPWACLVEKLLYDYYNPNSSGAYKQKTSDRKIEQ